MTTQRGNARYDQIAQWYETEFLTNQRRGQDHNEFADHIGVDQAIVELLGRGSGTCLEVGCGTGIYADRIGSLGRVPIGVDISAGMLSYAQARLPVAQGDGGQLPFGTATVDAVIGIMIHSDMPDFAATLAEISRVLRPGGTFLHVGVHPCFIGHFADRTDNDAIVIRPGYLETSWVDGSGPDAGQTGQNGQVRDKVGAAHYPLSALLNDIAQAGFTIRRTAEGFAPTPITFSLLATK